MYTPAHFAADPDQARALLAGITVGDLVTATAAGPIATFLPLLPDFGPDAGPNGSLLGHMARPNDQWRTPHIGEAMVIAHGPDAYVSPSWYPSKAEHGRAVPTWNYVTLHAYGTLVIHDDPAWVDGLVRRLTDLHEADRPHPWTVDDAPERFYRGQLRAVVGVELRITRLEAKLKLSQNRPPADIDGVVAGMQADGAHATAALVAEHRPTPHA